MRHRSYLIFLTPSDASCLLQNTPPCWPASQIPPHKLNALLFAKLPQILNALLAQINILHVRGVLCRCPRNSAGHHDGVRFQHDSVIYNLIDGQCDKIVILNDGALVCRVPTTMSASHVHTASREPGRYLNNTLSVSLSASMTLYSKTSFSSAPPTT